MLEPGAIGLALALASALAYYLVRRRSRGEGAPSWPFQSPEERAAEEERRRAAAEAEQQAAAARAAEAEKQLAAQRAAEAERRAAQQRADEAAALESSVPFDGAGDAADGLAASLAGFATPSDDKEKGHRTTMPAHDFTKEKTSVELAFERAGELLRRFAEQRSFVGVAEGTDHWDSRKVVRHLVTFAHPRIPTAKFSRPKEVGRLTFLMDISGSCAPQAEMFMAIAIAVVGPQVQVFVGMNGSAMSIPLATPSPPPKSYAQAKGWVQQEFQRISGRAATWTFAEFLEKQDPDTLIFFGDFDGVDQYEASKRDSGNHRRNMIWFANVPRSSRIPFGFDPKTFFPEIMTPEDFARTLQNMR